MKKIYQQPITEIVQAECHRMVCISPGVGASGDGEWAKEEDQYGDIGGGGG